MQNKKKMLGVLSTAALASLFTAALSTNVSAAVQSIVINNAEDGKNVEFNMQELLDSRKASMRGQEGGELYEAFNEMFNAEGNSIVAWNDDKTGYVAYEDVMTAYQTATRAGENFVVDTFTESAEATEIENVAVAKVEDGKFITDDKEEEVDPSGLKLDKVRAIAVDKVEVKLEEAVEAVSAGAFEVTEKNGDKVLEVTDAVVDGKYVVLTVDGLKAGDAYTLTVNEVSKNFAAIDKVKDAPEVKKAEYTDDNVVTVTFDVLLDEESAEDIANYSFTKKGVEVLEAKLTSDRDAVELTTSGITKGKYTVTAENVKSSDGIAMKSKDKKSFSARSFKVEPKLDKVERRNSHNNNTVLVYFKSEKELNKESAENIENYSIKGLEILEASYDSDTYDEDKKTSYVVLKTDEQKANEKYILKVSNISDTSVLENTMTKTASEDFRGGYEDKNGPKIDRGYRPKAISDVKVKIVFEDPEDNALDINTLLDVDNYVFDEELEVESVEVEDEDAPYDQDGRTVILTTSPQEEGKSYKLTIKNIADEFGNTIDEKDGKNIRIRGVKEDVAAPYVKKTDAIDTEKIEITFDDEVEKDSATDATNYVVYKGSDRIGTAISAKFKKDSNNKIVVLEVPELTANKSYKILINGVKDMSDNETEDAKAEFVAPVNSNDTDAPTCEDVMAEAGNLIQLEFDESVEAADDTTDIVVTVKQYDKDDKPIEGTEITLKSALIFDDGMKLYARIDDKNDANPSHFVDGADYYVSEITNLVDANRNAYKVPALNDDKEVTGDAVTFQGTKDEGDRPELVDISQEDVKTILVTFDAPVDFDKGDTTEGLKIERIDDADSYDDYCQVNLVSNSPLDDGDKFNFNFTEVLKSFAGRQVRDDDEDDDETSVKTEFEATIDDDVDPFVDGVEAINENQIEITFDDDLSTAGTYKITYDKDEDDDKEDDGRISITKTELDDNVVTLTVKEDLDPEVQYTIKASTLPRDLAKNSLDKDWKDIFMGSSKKVSKYISGVEKIYDTKIKVKGVDIESSAYIKLGNIEVTTASGIVAKDNEITTLMPLLADETYTVNSDDHETYSYSFKGFVDESNGMQVIEDGGNKLLTFYDMDTEDAKDYVIKYWDYSTSELVALDKVATRVEDDEDKTLKGYKVNTLLDADKDFFVFIYVDGDADNALYGAKIEQ